ncbi:MAG: SLATT domain-containing protein [Beijerinckiaceae bacterium]|nr:SLATT domain-containing protein [Beijerinckiaceae bacterium]
MQNHPSRATDHLLSKMWKTKGSRFNAHSRLRARHWASVVATSILAMYLVALSLYQLTFADALSATENKILSIGGVVVSIFLIIITLVETARNYLGDAEKMHQSALAISELYNRFQALTLEEANAQRLQFNDEYSIALKENPVDHKDIDYKRFTIRSARDLEISGWRYGGLVAEYAFRWFCEFSLYLALILAPLIGLIVAFWMR